MRKEPIFCPAPQGTAQWLEDKRGSLSASHMADCMDYLKNGSEGAKRKALKMKLITERLTGRTEDTYITAAMQWGIDTEKEARSFYEEISNRLVVECGFVKDGSIEWLGCSPDGLVGSDGLVEIKCPNSATHLEYLMSKNLPEKYRLQCLLQAVVTGREWIDLFSYDPRFIHEHQRYVLFHIVPTDEERFTILDECKKLLKEVDEMMKLI